MDNLKAFSANINLHTQAGAPAAITFPLVQGMGFVTGQYKNVRPVIQSSTLFRALTPVTLLAHSRMVKYRILLEDGKTVSVDGQRKLRLELIFIRGSGCYMPGIPTVTKLAFRWYQTVGSSQKRTSQDLFK